MPIRPAYDGAKIRNDMAARGWMDIDLAKAAGLAPATIMVFLNGQIQTPRSAEKIARALGHTPKRYVVPLKTVA